MILLALLGIIILVALIAVVKLDTFISFILVSIFIGICSGMKIANIGTSIKTGIGTTLGDLILIIGFGAMLGKLVAENGAAQQITDKLMSLFSDKYLRWGVAFVGFIIGIPLFYNAGFIILIPFIFTIASYKKIPILYIAIPMLSALSVAHGFLPPHPSPTAIATQLNANIGQTLFYGILIAIPAIIIAGPVFGGTLLKYNPVIDTNLFKIKRLPNEQLPSLKLSLGISLLPVVLLISTSVLKHFSTNQFIQLLAEPYFGMLLSVLLAIYFLGIRQGYKTTQITKQLEEAFKSSSYILLIIAGAGALKQIFSDSGISQNIGQLLQNLDISPLILGWMIAGLLRICVGSATAAGLTAVGIIAPIIASKTGVNPELMVLSIGAGSLMFSHLNDSGFWLFKEYFNLSIKETLQTWTVMETIVSIVGLIGVLILDQII